MPTAKLFLKSASTRRLSPRALPPDSPTWRAALRRKLAAWFRRAARDLPWRRDASPYRVWISEIMLQQTTVAAVVPYFERFVARFPDVHALAAAPEDDVLRLWEGLGYYRRARMLHRAARLIVAEHAGRFPDQADAIRRLPGIGRYTAGAIASIAFDRREPILEANTLRVYSRLLGLCGDPRTAAGQRRLWEAAASWLPARGVSTFNQALMELGATVCSPRQPRCDACPVAALCQAHLSGDQQQIPPAAKRPAVEDVRATAVVVRRADRVLVVRRAAGERWAGLWDFLRFADEPDLAAAVRGATGLSITSPRHLAALRHQVTRFRIALAVFEAQALDRDFRQGAAELRWVTLAQLADLPLSMTGRKIAGLLTPAPTAPAAHQPQRRRPRSPSRTRRPRLP